MRYRPPVVPVDGADTIGLNMARPVGDGEQIVVGLAPALRAADGARQLGGLGLGPGSPPASGPGRPGRVQRRAEGG